MMACIQKAQSSDPQDPNDNDHNPYEILDECLMIAFLRNRNSQFCNCP